MELHAQSNITFEAFKNTHKLKQAHSTLASVLPSRHFGILLSPHATLASPLIFCHFGIRLDHHATLASSLFFGHFGILTPLSHHSFSSSIDHKSQTPFAHFLCFLHCITSSTLRERLVPRINADICFSGKYLRHVSQKVVERYTLSSFDSHERAPAHTQLHEPCFEASCEYFAFNGLCAELLCRFDT